MPNLIELIDRSSIIRNKINSIVSGIKNDIASGKIPNKTAAFIKLRDDVEAFISSLVNPTLIVRPAYKIPISDDINAMMYEAFNDINNVYNNIGLNEQVVQQSYDRVNIERNVFTYMTKYIDRKISELESIVEAPGTTFSDTFINYTNADMGLVEDIPANIDTAAGALVLNKTNVIEHPFPNIIVKPSSNGYPGDTHQAHVSGEQIVFSGELDQHTNMEALIDTQKDTWFEYEMFQITQKEYDKVCGYGFEYKEGNRWITDDNKLILELEVKYPKAYNMNWIMIDPFIPVQSSYIPAKIISIDIDNYKGTITPLVTEPIPFKREMIFIFPVQKVYSIKIVLEQDNRYVTRAGHTYYTTLETNQNMLTSIDSESVRIDGPMPSVEYLGIKYQPTTGLFKQPEMDELYNAPDSKKVFGNYNNDPRVYNGTELIDAYRYQIGIRAIDSKCTEFATLSQYISKEFDFITVKNQLVITADDDTAGGDIIYSVSIDNGKTWTIITTATPFTSTTTFTKARLKIDLSRPTGSSKYNTPIVYSYSLRGEIV